MREHGDSLTRVEEPEISFAFSLNDRVLAGKIDLLRHQGESQVEVVDFKTSKAAFAEKDQVGLQLDLYALGVEDGIGRAVALQTAHFLTDDNVQTHEWLPPRKESSQARLTEVLERIEQGDFAPDKSYCHRCEEFRSICPHVPDWLKGETSDEEL